MLRSRRFKWIMLALYGTIGVLLVVFHERYYWIAVGIWNREAFFQGRPTSFWREHIRRNASLMEDGSGVSFRVTSVPQDGALSLGPLFDKNANAHGVILQLLNDDDLLVRMYAILAAQSFGKKGTFALATLRQLTGDENRIVAKMAEIAIYIIEVQSHHFN